MSNMERIYQIDNLIRIGRYGRKQLAEALSVSVATVQREIGYMQDRLHAPIEYDRADERYRYSNDHYQLPGIWLSEPEIRVLLIMQQLVSEIAPGGVSAGEMQSLSRTISRMLSFGDVTAADMAARVQVRSSLYRRSMKTAHFGVVGEATLTRKRLLLVYNARSTESRSEREVSPQRLVYYRNNWYLDAWCHARGDLRRFSVDAIQQAQLLNKTSDDLPVADLERLLDGGYGVFAGEAKATACIRFNANSARWVRDEHWHPAQRVQEEPDGGIQLEVPFGHSHELVMDILRHGDGVEVLSPPELRAAVLAAAEALVRQHR